MITMEFLNSVRGDKSMYVEDGTPEERKKLAERLAVLLKEGQAIFLIQGNETRRIVGYDAANNQWQVFAEPLPRPAGTYGSTSDRHNGREYISARGTRVTAIGRSAGG
jgi:hypothetical protein